MVCWDFFEWYFHIIVNMVKRCNYLGWREVKVDAKFSFTRAAATFVFSIVAHVEETIPGTTCAKLFPDIIKNPTKIKFKTISDVHVCWSQYFILEICVIFDK